MNSRRIQAIAFMSMAIGFTAAATASAKSVRRDGTIGSDSAMVAKVVEGFHNALASGDSSAALAFLAPDATILESGGIESRRDYRSHHLAGDIEFAKSVKSVRAPMTVTLSGTTAWTTATSTTQGDFNGRAINSIGAESMILSKSGTKWMIRSIHWSSRTRRTAGSSATRYTSLR